MKKLYKIIISISIISIIGIIVCKSNIDFVNLSNNHFSLILLKEILYDISVCVFSAMIIVWGIDVINDKNREREEQKRLSVLYQKIIPVLKDYYDFYVKLYIATRKEKVGENESVLQSLFNDKVRLIQQIKVAEPFYKDGFYSDGNFDFFLEYVKGKRELPKALPWYKCWNIDNEKFTKRMRQIEQDFSFMFPADLLCLIEALLKLVEPINNLSNFLEFSKKFQAPVSIFPIEFFVDNNKLDEIFDALENVMKYVSENSKEDMLKIDIKYFNERNTSPILGDALKDIVKQ
ncbi:MAG: hypothetical protein ACYCX2_02270 [Christensenellales bacterium]